jgi:hypothetical protein
MIAGSTRLRSRWADGPGRTVMDGGALVQQQTRAEVGRENRLLSDQHRHPQVVDSLRGSLDEPANMELGGNPEPPIFPAQQTFPFTMLWTAGFVPMVLCQVNGQSPRLSQDEGVGIAVTQLFGRTSPATMYRGRLDEQPDTERPVCDGDPGRRDC